MTIFEKGIEDLCSPVIEAKTRMNFGEEVTLVVTYPDCNLYLGMSDTGVIHGFAKVVDDKIVWAKCTERVPKFKERFL